MTPNKIKKLYKYTSIAILLAALLVTGYFVRLGLNKKDSTDISNQTINTSEKRMESESQPQSESYNLIIDKINIQVPIMVDVDGNNKDEYNKALENGIAQLKGSARPGKNGNSFLFGHSSYLPDKPGNYKEIFKQLNDLNVGDTFEVQSKAARYVYRATDKKVVEPTDVAVAAQNSSLKQMTLMTCWPIGTTKQRLVVVGELVE